MPKTKMTAIKSFLSAATIFGLISISVTAEEALEGTVILEISGEVSAEEPSGKVLFDVRKLEALGLHEVTTETPWTEGVVVFQGVLGRDLLTSVGAAGVSISLTAINDYSVDIPISDFYEYDVIFATRIDDKLMSVRDRGPIWIIYPWSSAPELKNEVYYSRSIWQLKSIVVRRD